MYFVAIKTHAISGTEHSLMKIAIVHYTSWPVIGGVESVIRQHAQLISRHGHEIAILCGEGTAFAKEISTVVIPELGSRDPCVRAAQREAYDGLPGQAYFRLLEKLQIQFSQFFRNFDRVIVHNIFTMPFNLAATQALSGFAEQGVKTIAWTHDLAAVNQDYKIPADRAFDLIRERHTRVKYVTISEARAAEFKKLTGSEVDAIIPNGLDFTGTCGITPEVTELVHDDLATSIILFYPTRILERKNIAFALQIIRALRDLGVKVRLLISAAQDLHNRSSAECFIGLKQLAADLQIQDSVSWVNNLFFVDQAQLHSLYSVADGILFPSRQEGFGLPLLEAAAYRLPVFCSNIEPLKSIAPSGTLLFDLQDAPKNIAKKIRNTLGNDDIFKSRKRLLSNYSAERLFRDKTEPFLQDLS
jgi:glycosyltransferase involved in cell wall biosynthesis